jgi:hypothetical protein
MQKKDYNGNIVGLGGLAATTVATRKTELGVTGIAMFRCRPRVVFPQCYGTESLHKRQPLSGQPLPNVPCDVLR